MSVNQNYTNVKVAVIGCGNWGKNLIRVLHGLGSLVGVCDNNPLKAQEFSQQYQIPAFTLEQVLSNKEIQAVFIATPSFTHYDIGVACLNAKKHVYIEKPFAHQLSQAKSLYNLSQQNNCVLMIGHLLQYHRAFNHIKQLKKNGTLGELRHIYANRFNFGKYRSEESVLLDYAPHDISMILSLVEELPHTVIATNANHLQHTVSDTASIDLSFSANVKAHIFASWLYPYKEQRMIVVGSKAIAIFEDSQPWESKLRLCHYPEQWNDGLPHPFSQSLENIAIEPAEPLSEECRHFLDCILNKTQPRTDGQEGLNVMTVLDAAWQSMRLGTPIQLHSHEISHDKPVTELA